MHGTEARKKALQGVRLHNPDYVKFAPSVRCGGPTFELPGEAAADKRPPSGTSRDPVRRGAAHFAQGYISVSAYSRAQSAVPWERHLDSAV